MPAYNPLHTNIMANTHEYTGQCTQMYWPVHESAHTKDV